MSRMRWSLRLLPVVGMLTASAVEIGDPRERVLIELGPPSGHIRGMGFELLYFPRVVVELNDGRVCAVRRRSEEEVRSRPPVDRILKRRVEAVRQTRQTHAEEALQALVDSAEYRLLTAAKKIERLAEFARNHPEVSIWQPLLDAQRALAEERRREARSQQIAAELEEWADQNARRAMSGRYAPPYMVSAGTTVYYVQPWTFVNYLGGGGAWIDRPPNCDARSRLPLTASPGSTWPYNFGMGSGGLRLGTRQSGMSW